MIQKIKTLFPQHPLQNLSANDFAADTQVFCAEAEVLADVVSFLRPQVVLEFGSWKGHSAILFANCLAAIHEEYAVLCVDTWLGGIEHYLTPEWYEQLYVESGRPTLWERFVGNVIRDPNRSNIYPLPMTTSVAHDFLLFGGVRADLMYIDAGRRYVDVRDDLKYAVNLLADEGAILGDDYHHPPVRTAVLEFLQKNHCFASVRGSKWLISRNGEPVEREGFTILAPNKRTSFSAATSVSHGCVVDARTAPREWLSQELSQLPGCSQQAVSKLATSVNSLALPEVLRLQHACIENGYFLVGRGGDGVVLTRDGLPVGSTVQFARPEGLPTPEAIRAVAQPLKTEVFIPTDIHWNNYYHWLCLAVSKIQLAKQTLDLPSGLKFAIPDYDLSAALGYRIGFSKTVWQQTVHVTGQSASVLALAPGIYQSPAVHFFEINSPQVAVFTIFEKAYAGWSEFASRLRTDNGMPKKICVLRRDKTRLADRELGLMQSVAVAYGFQCGFLEDLDFYGQAQLFRNADIVLAPHGAGLGNLIFSREGQTVVEFNRVQPHEKEIRPWFYMLARQRNLAYRCLDLSNTVLTADHLHEVLESVS